MLLKITLSVILGEFSILKRLKLAPQTFITVETITEVIMEI